jgi:3-hydroxyacyl-[acyl-carrier-protein] dehydratase
MMKAEAGSIDIQNILEMLPHRYPFLLVDRVVDYKANDYLLGYKNVTFNEPFFQGHFPGLPVMPGVLILEALAQAGGILLVQSSEEDLNEKVFMFTGLEKVRFRSPVRPGDRLDLRLENFKRKLKLARMTGHASINGHLAAEAVLTAAVVDKEDL